MAKDNKFIETSNFDKIINHLFVNKNILNIYNIIIDFFAHKIMSDINVFNVNIKLNVLCENDCVLIIFKNHNNFKIRIVKS